MKPEGKPNGSMTQTNLNQVHIPQVHTPQAHRRILTPRHLTLTENAGPAAAGRYVVAGIIGGMLGSYVGHVWLGCFLAIMIAACKKKR